jgi:sortase A
MNPNNSSQGGDGLVPAGQSPAAQPPQNPSQPQQPRTDQAAAARVIRTQIDALYGDRSVASSQDRPPAVVASRQYASNSPHTSAPVQSQAAETPAADAPYQRTHTVHPQPQAKDWEAYHSAWQNYYQQYYDAYYQHKTAQEKAQREKEAPASVPDSSTAHDSYFSAHPSPEPQPTDDEATTTKEQALYELRERLLGRVRTQAKKIRRSRHFIPIAAALTVVLIFTFLQYNRVLIGAVYAYVSPGSIDPERIVIDPSAGTQVSGDPRLIIPKINVDVPVLYDVGADHNSQMAAMEKGVAHFAIPGANSHPGEIGNTVLSGHSSNDLFDPGEYKFIFAQLERLQIGDTIYANYNGVRYTYVITKKEVVRPSQVDKLIYPTDKPIMTLITCTPLGTAQDRLLVTAEQISPDPAAATAAPAGSGSQGGSGTAIPGNSATLLERLFGGQ